MQHSIYIGNNLLARKEIFAQHVHGQQVMIVTQNSIANFYLDTLKSALHDFQSDVIFLPEGEHNKIITEWQKIFDVLIEKKHDRSTTLIALGGGMVGDMTGFAAASYQRGVNYIQIPTTLIAQVDSAIGGKTGVNHGLLKNSIGAFHQPECVIADIDTLKTLSQREFVAGIAEVIKYGLIFDADFFSWLENNKTAVLNKNNDALLYIVNKAISHKLNIVRQDEKDQHVRQLLNFGHTFGHALETAFSYNTFLHGEAVAAGMLMAAALSAELGKINYSDVSRIYYLLNDCGLFLESQPVPDPMQLIDIMQRDKKNRGGKIHFILLNEIGKAEKISDISQERVIAAIKKGYPSSYSGGGNSSSATS